MAPELLPMTFLPGTPATQKGDVYSFAIILEEIVVRGGPYETARQFLDIKCKLAGSENLNIFKLNTHTQRQIFAYSFIAILERVEAHEPTPFRPFIGQRDCPPDVLDLMEKCWADNPEERPPFVTIRSTVRDIMK